MFNPEQPECPYCSSPIYRKGLCFEHWEEAEECRGEFIREMQRDMDYERESNDSAN